MEGTGTAVRKEDSGRRNGKVRNGKAGGPEGRKEGEGGGRGWQRRRRVLRSTNGAADEP